MAEKVNEAMMAKLLQEPEVRKSVLKMTANELAFFKKLLVNRGIYARYVKEQEKTAGNSAKDSKK